MMGTFDCIYETPCGWCSKWDKKCDKKIPERGQRAKCNPVYDASTMTNQVCINHEWECCGISTAGITYRCKKCGTTKFDYHINFNGGINHDNNNTSNKTHS